MKYDWTKDLEMFTEDEIASANNFITNLTTYEFEDNIETVDFKKYNIEQNVAINFIKEKYKKNKTYFLILTGGPGTGKTEVIKGIRCIYKPKELLVTGSTGVASNNAFANTIFSELSLPVGAKRREKLPYHSARILENKLRYIKAIIIDEYSFISQDILYYIFDVDVNKLKNHKKIWRNFIILVGDIWQLPPVCATTLWSKPKTGKTTSASSMRGYVIYKTIFQNVCLTKNMRIQKVWMPHPYKKKKEFAHILSQIKFGTVTYDEYNNILVPYLKIFILMKIHMFGKLQYVYIQQ